MQRNVKFDIAHQQMFAYFRHFDQGRCLQTTYICRNYRKGSLNSYVAEKRTQDISTNREQNNDTKYM